MLFCGDAVPVEPEPAAELGPASSNFCAGRAGPPGFGREPGFLPGCFDGCLAARESGRV